MSTNTDGSSTVPEDKKKENFIKNIKKIDISKIDEWFSLSLSEDSSDAIELDEFERALFFDSKYAVASYSHAKLPKSQLRSQLELNNDSWVTLQTVEFERPTFLEVKKVLASASDSGLDRTFWTDPLIILARKPSFSKLFDNDDNIPKAKEPKRIGAKSIAGKEDYIRREFESPTALNNLFLSISTFVAENSALDHYWDLHGFKISLDRRPVDSAQRMGDLKEGLRRYSKAAFLLHGRTVDLDVLNNWIPMDEWTGSISQEEIDRVTKEVKEEIIQSILTNLFDVMDEMRNYVDCIREPPRTTIAFDEMMQPLQSQCRRFEIYQMVKQHAEVSYGWIENTLQIFSDIIPIQAILSDERPGCLGLVRRHLLCMMVGFAGIHYDTVLMPEAYDRLQKEHDAECHALATQGAKARPDPTMVRNSELLEKYEILFHGEI